MCPALGALAKLIAQLCAMCIIICRTLNSKDAHTICAQEVSKPNQGKLRRLSLSEDCGKSFHGGR